MSVASDKNKIATSLGGLLCAALLLPIALAGCGGGASGSTSAADDSVSVFAIESVMPVDGAAEVGRDDGVSATFSSTIDCTTISSSTFSLKSTGGAEVGGSFICSGSRVAFKPDAALAEKTLYTATFTISAKDSGGIGLKSDYTWSFTTGSRAWGTAQLLEQSSHNAWYAQLQADGQGALSAAWQQDDSGHRNLLVSGYEPGNGWSEGALLNDVAGGGVGASALAVNSSGEGVVVWAEDHGDGSYALWASRRSSGTWGRPSFIATIFGYPHDFQVVMNDAGDAAAAWHQTTSGGEYLIVARFVASDLLDPWRAQLIRSGALDHVTLAMDASGNIAVTWEEWDEPAQVDRIWWSRFSVETSTWAGPSLITAADSTEDATEPTLAGDANGNLIAAWVQYNSVADIYGVWTAHYDAASGIWGAAHPVSTGLLGAGDPQIAMNGSGDAALTWYADDASASFAAAAFYSASDDGWTAPEIISNGQYSTWGGRIALDPDGNAVTVWVQYDANQGKDVIWSNRFIAGEGAWKGAQIISGTGGTSLGADVTFDAFGNGVAVWQQYAGASGFTPIDLWVRRLE